jgi:hypothetical protein
LPDCTGERATLRLKRRIAVKRSILALLGFVPLVGLAATLPGCHSHEASYADDRAVYVEQPDSRYYRSYLDDGGYRYSDRYHDRYNDRYYDRRHHHHHDDD